MTGDSIKKFMEKKNVQFLINYKNYSQNCNYQEETMSIQDH